MASSLLWEKQFDFTLGEGAKVMPTVECDFCGVEFERIPSEIDKYDHHFCCREHYGLWLRGKNHPMWKGGEVTVECDWCGREFKKTPHNADRVNHHFCSTECMSKYLSENFSEENHPSWSGGKVELKCEYCGENYKRVPAEAEKSRFCSRECKDAWQSEVKRGKNHPDWEKAELECDNCGETYTVKPSQADRSRFCSKECKNEAYKREYRGNENPQWKSGISKEPYDENWTSELRERVRKRDSYECQLCGLGQEEQRILWEKPLEVHHINGDKKDSRIENLITLCQYCHARWHSFFGRGKLFNREEGKENN